MKEVKVVEGSEAVALAVKACRPHVVSAFPISPQTHIVESLARMVADGELSAEYIRTESEFSAASVLAGASAAGAPIGSFFWRNLENRPMTGPVSPARSDRGSGSSG